MCYQAYNDINKRKNINERSAEIFVNDLCF